MSIEVGPTGNLVTGDVLDVDKNRLEQMIKHYDELLYLKWNPKKNGGQGLWELRRRPQTKVIVDSIQLYGICIHKLDYKEYDVENHIFDLPALNYSVLDRIKAADVWSQIDYNGKHGKVTQWLNDMDRNYYKVKDDAKQKKYDEMHRNLMEDKRILKDFQERIVSGVDPRHLFRFWK